MPASPSPEDDADWLAFRDALQRATGVALGQYKQAQLKRRLASVMLRRGIPGWQAFATAIAADPALFEQVRDTMTINVSEVFRQADRFTELLTPHIPRLQKERPALKLWSAGCSIGCEPYTLAMILAELDPESRHSIIATDVDLPILTRAREGRGYHAQEVQSVPAALRAKYLIEEADGTYAVTAALKRRITFRRHDLLSDRYPSGLDMILCRNVVIYFNEDAKRHLYAGFASALRPGGLLFVGGSEMIMRSHELGFRIAGTSIYEKAA